MSDFDPEMRNELRKIEREIAMRKVAETFAYWQLRPYAAGSRVTLDLMPLDIAGVQVEPGGRVEGTIVDQEKGLMQVEEIRGSDQNGMIIGLGTACNMNTPVGIVVPVQMKLAIKPRQTAIYYFPEDMQPDNYDYPSEFHALGGLYGRLVVGSTVLFDIQ